MVLKKNELCISKPLLENYDAASLSRKPYRTYVVYQSTFKKKENRENINGELIVFGSRAYMIPRS